MNKPASNPHGDPARCDTCHDPAPEGEGPLRWTGNVSQLCRSCHDGRLATREVHPVDVIPTLTTRQRIPSDFPLEDGKVSCLTCHDVTWGCGTGPAYSRFARTSLRGDRMAGRMMFCFHCHAKENYHSFNAHDQLEGKTTKVDTCAWCHTRPPDASLRYPSGALQTLRRTSAGVCEGCHRVAQNHPAGASHVGATPPSDMMWHMSAHEMQPTMSLSFPELVKLARGAKRAPRAIPLDDRGRITCFTCHNPHEKGLLPARNPRSLGAEPKQAANHRLRTDQRNICAACHEK